MKIERQQTRRLGATFRNSTAWIGLLVFALGNDSALAQPPEFQGPKFGGAKLEYDTAPEKVVPKDSGLDNPTNRRLVRPPSIRLWPEPATPDRTAHLMEKLDQTVGADTEMMLADVPDTLSRAFQIAIQLDEHALRVAGIDPASTNVVLRSDKLKLRTMLRNALAPLRLRGEISENGITITPDFTALARDGIATDRWVGIEGETLEKMQADLKQKITLNLTDVSLKVIPNLLASQLATPIVIDRLALEDEGLSEDFPINVSLRDVSLAAAMDRMLQEFRLVLNYQNETWLITTQTAAEDSLINRIYYLEGTGMTADLYDPVQLIQTTIDPETWEALGGVGTMSAFGRVPTSRPGLVISTTFSTHLKIEALLRALRAGTVGPDPPTGPASPEETQMCGTCLMGYGSNMSHGPTMANFGSPMQTPAPQPPAPPQPNPAPGGGGIF